MKGTTNRIIFAGENRWLSNHLVPGNVVYSGEHGDNCLHVPIGEADNVWVKSSASGDQSFQLPASAITWAGEPPIPLIARRPPQ